MNEGASKLANHVSPDAVIQGVLVLIDGDCLFCNQFARFVATYDGAASVRFFPLQSSLAKGFLRELGIEVQLPYQSSYVVCDGRVMMKSAGVFALFRKLDAPLSLLALFAWTRWIGADLAYDFVARHRYRWFGKTTRRCELLDVGMTRERLLTEAQASNTFAQLISVVRETMSKSAQPKRLFARGAPTSRTMRALLTCFLAVQLTLTVRNENLWPFSAHNFFASTPRRLVPQITMAVVDAAGHRVEGLPGQFMPMEFFRANGIAQVIFAPSSPPSPKESLAQDILQRLRDRPWRAFDETLASITAGSDFCPTTLEVLVQVREFDPKAPSLAGRLVEEAMLFVYRDQQGAERQCVNRRER